MKKYLFLLAAILINCSLLAQVPNSISWQGILQDASGNLLNGQYDMAIKLYDVSTGGSALWTEKHNDMLINSGLVNLTLGENTPLTLQFSTQYWLEITVDAGTPLTRVALTSVPYSLNSKHAESATETDPKWSGTTNQTSSIGRTGKVGIGTNSPSALLHTYGISNGEGNVLFEGTYKSSSPGNPPTSGAGTRMMWYPDKGAFRAGSVSGTEWDFASIGQHSSAMGYNTTASGYNSTAMGYNTTASGDASVAIGWFTTAKSFCETVLGIFNTDYTPIGASTLNAADRLFVIGNGTGFNSKSNAVTVLKNGCMGLQTATTPTYALELPNNSSNSIGRGRAYAWATYSDGRLKSDRQVIPYGLNEIMKLEPIKYFHHNSITENGRIIISDEGTCNIGFIAQDLFKIIPEIVSRPENENIGLWSLSYEKLTPILVKAIQEQQEIIDNQKKKNDSQDMLIQIQNQKIEELEKKLEEIMRSIQSNK